MNKLKLNGFVSERHGLTAAWGSVLAEAAAVCLENQNHQNGALLVLSGIQTLDYNLQWEATTEQHRKAHNDLQDATEHGACGIAIALIEKLTDNVVIERSKKGTGFDYWLGKNDEEPLFTNKSRLEISGILKGSDIQFRSRIKQKIEQMNITKDIAPGYVAVIDFGNPKAHVGQV